MSYANMFTWQHMGKAIGNFRFPSFQSPDPASSRLLARKSESWRQSHWTNGMICQKKFPVSIDLAGRGFLSPTLKDISEIWASVGLSSKKLA